MNHRTDLTEGHAWVAASRIANLVEDVIATQMRLQTRYSLPQYELLTELQELGGSARQLDLEHRLGWHRMRIIYELRRLDRIGALRVDRRSHHLRCSITTEGASTMDEATRIHSTLVGELLDHHIDAETRVLLEKLGSLVDSWQAIE